MDYDGIPQSAPLKPMLHLPPMAMGVTPPLTGPTPTPGADGDGPTSRFDLPPPGATPGPGVTARFELTPSGTVTAASSPQQPSPRQPSPQQPPSQQPTPGSGFAPGPEVTKTPITPHTHVSFAPPPSYHDYYDQQHQAYQYASTPAMQTRSTPDTPRYRQRRPLVASPFAGTDIRTIQQACEFSLREYQVLQRQRRELPLFRVSSATTFDSGVRATASAAEQRERTRQKIEERLWAQGSVVLADLDTLMHEVATLAARAEARRWRQWMIGGLGAALIPIVRRLFPRPDSPEDEKTDFAKSTDDGEYAQNDPFHYSDSDYGPHRRGETKAAANDTEHAFRSSRALISRLLSTGVQRCVASPVAAVAAFLLSVLCVFEAEVSVRVARTITRRLRRLRSRVERGVELDYDASSPSGGGGADLAVLNGWRWRVLLW